MQVTGQLQAVVSFRMLFPLSPHSLIFERGSLVFTERKVTKRGLSARLQIAVVGLLLIAAGLIPSGFAQSTASAPTFADQASNQTVSAGTTARFTVTAIGTVPLSLQWQRFPQGGTGWVNLLPEASSPYSGVTTATLSVQATTVPMSGDQFRCVATNAAGSATSTIALLTVEAPRYGPTIVTQPAGQTVTVGQSATLTIVVNAAPAATYQWYRGSNAILGATGSSLRFPSARTADSGNYFVEVSNPSGTVVSKIVALAVIEAANAVDFYTFRLLAGQAGVGGAINGTGTEARFKNPNGLAVDAAGNLYVADESSHLIRKVSPAGVVTTFAGLALSGGNEDGTGTQARFLYPRGVAIAADGTLFVADTFNHTIRRITQAGVVTTFAGRAGNTGALDGKGTAASFNFPVAIALDPAGNAYVADRSNFTIRKITADGVVSTLAGSPRLNGSTDGQGAGARFDNPGGIVADRSGNVFVADNYNHTIRRISPAGVVSTFAGLAGLSGSNDGTGSNARFLYPNGLATDSFGNIYVAEGTNSTLRRISPAGLVTTIGGLAGTRGFSEGTGSDARFHTPIAVALDSSGNLFVADHVHFTLSKGFYTSAAQLHTQPDNQLTMATVPVTFAVSASGTGSLTYRWQRLVAGASLWINVQTDATFSGVTTDRLTILNPATLMSGDQFRCVVSNALGSATSETASLTVTPLVIAPTIVTPPSAVSVFVGEVASFAVTAAGTGPLVYQWHSRSGEGPWIDLSLDASGRFLGASSPMLQVLNSAFAMNGDSVRCTVSNSSGAVTSEPARLTVKEPASRLTNVSVRASAGAGDQALIVGVAVSGGSKTLLIRSTGPSLGMFGLKDFLPDPRLTLYSSSGAQLGQNDDWSGLPVLATAMSQAGAFPLPVDSKDAALLTTVESGGYTLHAAGATAAKGTTLLEVYDLDSGTGAARLTNLSALSRLTAAGEALIVGFVIKGNAPRALLIRGVGPTLSVLGVTNTLADPKIEVFSSNGNLLGTNDNWSDDVSLPLIFNQVGAFPLIALSRDAALLLALPPGAYTVHVTGVANGVGATLAEIYEIP